MKARNLGRLELLAWINEVTEADYPKVELCSDAIAFCQILDAIHPVAGIQLHRLNFNAKNKDDFARNLKVLDDMLQKLKVNKRIQIE
jgi:RP/EB family microtubule-associated protein